MLQLSIPWSDVETTPGEPNYVLIAEILNDARAKGLVPLFEIAAIDTEHASVPADLADPNDPTSKEKVLPLAVRQQFVKTGTTKGDLVAVTSGLKAGDEIVSGGVFKLQNNGAVKIDNSVKPDAEENPNPPET